MDVVGHKAIVVAAQGGRFVEEFEQETSVGFVVGRLMEDGLPVIATGEDVVGGLWS